jgi:putative FmdB family regulatory protein
VPLYDYHCKKCDETFDEFRQVNQRLTCKCPKCGTVAKKLPSVARLDYYNMGVDSGFPTAIDKWDKMHRKEARRQYD